MTASEQQPQKPFLTVETGEAYQPIRLTYNFFDKDELISSLNNIKCLEKKSSEQWNWLWKSECDDIHFESLDSYERNLNQPLSLGSFSFHENKNIAYLNLFSFKRACLAVPFFHRTIDPHVTRIHHADFINKVYALDERRPLGLAELFKEEELETILQERLQEYHKVQEECEYASSADEALRILAEYTDHEANKKLPFTERYLFDLKEKEDPDMIFLGFYIFLRGRELVAIRRWLGETNYTPADAADETIEKIFGGVGVDIIE